MDDLYCNLENYQDENVLSELKIENQELKCKLEEYATTLAQLQKDFDILSTEYKKLELNYSSLLKTARAEIERKSQLITNLNLEKDKLVIESIKNRGWAHKRKINSNASRHQTRQVAKEGNSAREVRVPADPHVVATDVCNTLLSQINNESRDKEDKKQSSGLNEKLCASEKESKSRYSDRDKDRDKSEIDNRKIKDHLDDVVGTRRVATIKDRRKSMPLLNREDLKFSSDEEQDHPRDHYNRRKMSSRDQIDRRHHEIYNGRNYPERKVPDYIRGGDRFGNNYDSYDSRDAYRRNNRLYRESDRHKIRDSRDKYELSHRSRRHLSPVRANYIVQEEYYNKNREANDRYHRSDNIRNCVLESPPPEKSHTSHRKSRDSDRQRLDRFHDDGENPMKHKISDFTEEPPCKRIRRESLNKQSDKHMNSSDIDVGGHGMMPKSKAFDFPNSSLQSPDYVHLENNPSVHHHVKEIMGTAATELDDPRLTSKKYVTNTYKDRVVLSTVAGRNVDIMIIDTTKWNKKEDKEVYKMPTPLREKPEISEDLVKDIYMGIDDPIANLSLESGEVLEAEEQYTVNDNKCTVQVDESDRSNINSKIENEQSHDSNLKRKEATTAIDNIPQTSSTSLSKNYKIPKISHENTAKQLDANGTQNKPIKKENTKQSHSKKATKEKRNVGRKLQPEAQEYNPLKSFSNALEVCENKSKKFVDISHRKHIPEKSIVSARDTVAGDLELSDETCDYTDVADEITNNKGRNVRECTDMDIFDCTPLLIAKKIHKEPEKPVEKDSVVLKQGTETLCKNKKFDNPFNSDGVESNLLTNTNKEDNSKDIKSKLCDLFGDTSSLITPEDLGIATQTPTKANLNMYASISENTQDALDLNVKDMENVQTRAMKLKQPNESTASDVHQVISKIKNNVGAATSTNGEDDKIKNSIEKSSPIQQIFQNINKGAENDGTIKTVIISTGMQNSCRTADVVHEEKQLNCKANDNVPQVPLLNLTALATSTPHKETQLVPDISCNSNTRSMTKDETNISSSDTQKNLDVPDLRIIVKRRRKPRGKTS